MKEGELKPSYLRPLVRGMIASSYCPFWASTDSIWRSATYLKCLFSTKFSFLNGQLLYYMGFSASLLEYKYEGFAPPPTCFWPPAFADCPTVWGHLPIALHSPRSESSILTMRSFTSLSLFLALSSSAFSASASNNDLEIRDVDECKAVTVIISVLSQYKASATSFCSSFISIPVRTVTSATARD